MARNDALEDRRCDERNKLYVKVIEVINAEEFKLMVNDEREMFLKQLEFLKTWSDGTIEEYVQTAAKLDQKLKSLKVVKKTDSETANKRPRISSQTSHHQRASRTKTDETTIGEHAKETAKLDQELKVPKARKTTGYEMKTANKSPPRQFQPPFPTLTSNQVRGVNSPEPVSHCF
jgi:hypothetical protein